MDEYKENPSALLDGEARGTTEVKLPSRLIRYAELKVKSDKIADYLTLQPDLPAFPGLAGVIQTCGSLLQFRNYYTVDDIRLHRANFCGYHLLCPFCSMRRGVKYAKAYSESIGHVSVSFPGIKLYHVVLTIKNGHDLQERFRHIEASITNLLRIRRNAKAGLRDPVEFNKALGGVFSFEIKRGENSGLWHPHIHALVLCYEPMDRERLSEEWKQTTGDSHEVWVEECTGELFDGAQEVFAYALKFSTMENEDIWHAFKLLKGKRMIRSFGVLRNVEVPEGLVDDELDDLPYYDMLYAFVYGQGYKMKSIETRIGGKKRDEEEEESKKTLCCRPGTCISHDQYSSHDAFP